jgi:hypothetical protein
LAGATLHGDAAAQRRLSAQLHALAEIAAADQGTRITRRSLRKLQDAADELSAAARSGLIAFPSTR